MITTSFNGATAFTVGSSHISSDTPCQDFCQWSNLDDHTTLAVLSDGAGSASHSHIGSKAICEVVNETLHNNSIWGLTDQSLHLLLIGHIRTKLLSIAEDLTINLKDLAGTLLVVIVRKLANNLEYKIIHLGDGVAACLPSNQEPPNVSTPNNGEFANETYFVTCSKALKKIQTTSGFAPFGSGFILMSDGSSDSLFLKKDETMAPACADMIEWLKDNDGETVSEALEDNLKNFIATKTSDDCSVAIIKHLSDSSLSAVEEVNPNDTDFAMPVNAQNPAYIPMDESFGIFSIWEKLYLRDPTRMFQIVFSCLLSTSLATIVMTAIVAFLLIKIL